MFETAAGKLKSNFSVLFKSNAFPLKETVFRKHTSMFIHIGFNGKKLSTKRHICWSCLRKWKGRNIHKGKNPKKSPIYVTLSYKLSEVNSEKNQSEERNNQRTAKFGTEHCYLRVIN